MAYKCIVCEKKTKDGVSLYEFPEDLEYRKKWMNILGLKMHMPSHRLCTDHFTQDQFKTNLRTKKFLISAALPFARECEESSTTISETTLDGYLDQFKRKDNEQSEYDTRAARTRLDKYLNLCKPKNDVHKLPKASTIYSKNTIISNINKPLSIEDVLHFDSTNDNIDNIASLPPYNVQEISTNDASDNITELSPYKSAVKRKSKQNNNIKRKNHRGKTQQNNSILKRKNHRRKLYPTRICDLGSYDLMSSERCDITLALIKEKFSKKTRIIKNYQHTNRQLSKKIDIYKNTIDTLKKELLLYEDTSNFINSILNKIQKQYSQYAESQKEFLDLNRSMLSEQKNLTEVIANFSN